MKNMSQVLVLQFLSNLIAEIFMLSINVRYFATDFPEKIRCTDGCEFSCLRIRLTHYVKVGNANYYSTQVDRFNVLLSATTLNITRVSATEISDRHYSQTNIIQFLNSKKKHGNKQKVDLLSDTIVTLKNCILLKFNPEKGKKFM